MSADAPRSQAGLAGRPGAAGLDDAPSSRQRLGTPQAVLDLMQRIERSNRLDRPSEVLERAARTVARPGIVRDVLTGSWLGHALHPLMTDFPLGMWLSASLLDLVGGTGARHATRRLVGLGVAAALPTAATGAAEWLQADQPARRVGVVHANVNSVGLVFYTASFIARRRGHHRPGVALGIVGGLAATAGGYLGGHLSLARKVGTRDPQLAAPATTAPG